jgi:hypothetical protein
MSGFEPCGLCGCAEGVRFPIPGMLADSVLCARCVNAAVSAHAHVRTKGCPLHEEKKPGQGTKP